MNHAIQTLEHELELLQTNEPIHRAAGDIKQADLQLQQIKEVKLGLAVSTFQWVQLQSQFDLNMLNRQVKEALVELNLISQ